MMRRLMVAMLGIALTAGLGLSVPTAEAQSAKPAASKAKAKKASTTRHRLNGYALWYGGPRFNGRTTAGNEVFDESKMTAAHRTLPFGTQVRVTNLRNNKSQIVTINDRMAKRRTVIIDVSRGVAQDLDMLNAGRVPVRLEIIR